LDRPVLALNTDVGERPRDANARLAAATDCNVLIAADARTAETLAKAIHHASSRHAAPFVAAYRHDDGELVAAAALAGHGTLFIGGVDALSPAAQKELKMLLVRKAESGTGPRIIAADTGMLYARVVAGTFDLHLFYQLNTIHVQPATEETSLGSRQQSVLEVPDALRPTPVASEPLPKGPSVFFSTSTTPEATELQRPLFLPRNRFLSR